MVVGFIGFGEADSSIALGLSSEGLKDIVCFDVMQDDPRFSANISERTASCGAVQVPEAAEVCRRADIVIAGTPSNFALSAAQGSMDGVHPGMIYMDVSTATPKDKQSIGTLMESRGALFVDGAMMGALLKDRLRSLCFCAAAAPGPLKRCWPHITCG